MKNRTPLAFGGIVFTTLLTVGGTAFGQCDTTPPTGAIEQNDPSHCGSDGTTDDPNGGCNYGGLWQDLGDADGDVVVYGTVGAWTTPDGAATRDLDWYRFNVPNGGTVTITYNASNDTTGADPVDFVGFFATGVDDCGGLAVEGYLFDCGGTYEAVLEPGSYGIITTVNGYGDGGASDCTTNYVATISVEGSDYECGDPSQGNCDEPHGGLGCNDFACCNSVCEFDAACCESGWDEVCAETAIDLCGYFVYECNSTGASPANDCATDPQVLKTSGIYDFDTTNAETDGPAQPQCGSPAGAEQLDKDVWFTYTMSGDGFLQAVTCGYLTWDTKVAAYGPYDDFDAEFDPTLLESDFVACNEDGCADGTYSSTLSFAAVGGKTYLIRVGGYLGENGPGQINVEEVGGCEPGTAVVGDNDVDTTGAIGINIDVAPCDPGPYGDDVLYNCQFWTFTPDNTDDFTISTCNQADFDTRLAVLTSGCDPSTVIACLDDTDGCAGFTTTIEINLEGGTEYTIVCGGYSAGDAGTGILTIGAGPPPDPCEDYENSCDNPQVVTLGDYDIVTAPCGDVDYTGFCDPGDFGSDILTNVYFMEFTPADDDDYTISTCNQAAFDTRIGVQTTCDDSSVIACLDDTDGCEGFTTTLTTALTGGQTYLIVIGGYGIGDAGDATVSITGGTPPDPCEGYDNNCDNPQVLAGDGDYEFDTTCAFLAGDRNWDMTGTCDPGTFGDDVNYNTYYFEYNAAADGDYTISTCNQAAYDTRVFVASACDPTSTIACNDDGTDDAGADCGGYTSNLQTTLSAGTYIIGVGGYGATSYGTGLLTVLGPEVEECPGDYNGDGTVDGADLTILLGDWGGSAADLNGDGNVDGADLTILLGAWGDCA